MNFLRLGTEPRPYAANSTGQQLPGTFRGGPVYEAVGEARAIFMDRLSRAIRQYLQEDCDKLQNSASFVVFSLFMVGRSRDRTKPIVMLVSDNKQVRTEAFRAIKDSGIMEDFPGFDLGHMGLDAEYENFRRLGSQANPMTVDPDSMSFLFPDETVDVFAGEPSAPGARRLAVYFNDGTTSCAVAEHVFSYRGRHFLHSAHHFLLPAQQAQSVHTLSRTTASDADDDEDECEIMGLSDDEEEDEDELVAITSSGSTSPVESGSEGAFDSVSASQTLDTALDTEAQDAHMSELQSRLETPKTLTEAKTPHTNTTWTKVGHVVLSSAFLDSAFVQIDMANFWYRPLPLESYHDYTETAPCDTAIKTYTPNSTIGGTLSGTPSFVRLPGSKIFQEVYIARLNRPLVPGDCGSCVKNAITGKIFGHVIAGSPKTGLVLLMPASRLFAAALDALSACDGADGGKLIGVKADVEAVSAEDAIRWSTPSFVASGFDVKSALDIWQPPTRIPPRSREDTHAFPTHNEGEPSDQSKFDKHGKKRARPSTPDRLAQDLAAQKRIKGVSKEEVDASLTAFISEWILPTCPEEKERLVGWLDQLPQIPLGRGSLRQDEATITDIYTPDLVAHLRHFLDCWACPTSPEEKEKLLQRWSNPQPPQINAAIYGGQYIPSRFLESERITPVSFLTSLHGFAELPNVLISPEYKASYIFAETVAALGHSFIPVKVHPSRNPRGGVFTPIGVAVLCASLSEGTEFQDTIPPFFVNFLVLDESPVDKGVFAIIGKPDIERVFGNSDPLSASISTPDIAGPYPLVIDDATAQRDLSTRP